MLVVLFQGADRGWEGGGVESTFYWGGGGGSCDSFPGDTTKALC